MSKIILRVDIELVDVPAAEQQAVINQATAALNGAARDIVTEDRECAVIILHDAARTTNETLEMVRASLWPAIQLLDPLVEDAIARGEDERPARDAFVGLIQSRDTLEGILKRGS